ncbi:tannase and feruloyl esterase [Cucurbitaria berberidis CBS 394.84]|uniref:Carboxylic ester hydrolase n=1 Tax=Cucurbitaria berberidis CBS 394.84 TaxID=1168544 RepID=A0A9P4LD11_9PLEO|nr:tannase and feruloyl esterase [Cucurbitaria berberidis CBS 394.84]KAF1850268.1 tannase and feruloyl esterase [Cucurbitaria berberidis CBS 394.84]
MKYSHLFTLLPHFCTTFAKDELSDTSPPRCAPDQFKIPDISHGVRVLSIEAKPRYNYPRFSETSRLPTTTEFSFCQVTIYLTHHTTDDILLGNKSNKDKVLVEVWLPLALDAWNGRLQATGGAAFATGVFDTQLGVAVQNGWAAVSTDGGHDADPAKRTDASWALNEDKSINWNLLHNFASRSSVEQILVGKSITQQYYGKQPHHTYWNGCSTGGRQGYAIAQRHPHLVDGILANAPAISFTHLVTGEFWPQLRMKMTNTYMSKCELDYYRAKAIEHCDMLDGVRDGIIEDPEECNFNPYHLAQGDDIFDCDGSQTEFTTEMAQLVDEIHRGPGISQYAPLFYGLTYGVPMDTLANITVSKDGVRSQNPFPISASWLKHILLQDPTFNLTNLDLRTYFDLFGRASFEFGGLLNTDNPDLSALRASGTKMITWHGIYDQMIPYQNTVAYRKKVEGIMGGTHEVDNYYRLFLAPGVEHCGGANSIGPVPKDPLAALVDWVENEAPPETLEAETTAYYGEPVTRDLCAWPAKSKYMGISDAKRASSWSCVGETTRPPTANNPVDGGRAQQILGGLMDRLEGLGLGLSIG